MADSDDEYDRKRRDKFRGERGTAEGSSYRSSDRREERSRGREEWSERYKFSCFILSMILLSDYRIYQSFLSTYIL